MLNHSQHNFRQRTTQADLDEIEDWTDRAARRMYEGAGLAPEDVDILNPYDGYAPMAQFFLEGFQWHGVKRGDAFAFYAGDIRVEGPHPFSSSGGNLGNGRTRTAMYTDSIEQLRGTAGARQVRVRAETALAAFTTPSSGTCSALDQNLTFGTRCEGRLMPHSGGFELVALAVGCGPIADPCAPLWRRARPVTPVECRSGPWRPDRTMPGSGR